MKRFATLTLEDSYTPIVTMVNVISGRMPIPVCLERTLNMILLYFQETSIPVFFFLRGRISSTLQLLE